MPFENHGSGFVDQENMRYAHDAILAHRVVLHFFVKVYHIMVNIQPFFLIDVVDQRLGLSIDAETDYFDLSSPFFVVHLHMNIVLHRFLTRRTPSSPEVDQPDLTQDVL